MNTAYVYLQLYKLFDNITPLKVDCGKLCSGACCEENDAGSGMYLFPGEKKVFDLLNPDWAKIETSDFSYKVNGKKKNISLLSCEGECDRYQRPLACRIFPLTPYLKDGELKIIIDPRAKSICPLATGMKIDEFDLSFRRNVERCFKLLMKNKAFADFMVDYSSYLSEYIKFYGEE